jgi:hypothetical protein
MNNQGPKVYYATVTESINQLRSKGYTIDFNLSENCIVCHSGKYEHDQFEIDEVYRYDGETDPADEATVYGISSHDGIKGILVTGSSINMSSMETRMLKKLSY